MTLAHRLIITACVAFAMSDAFAHGPHDYVSASDWIEESIESAYPKENRSFRVRLPTGYESQRDREYPVLFLLDGEHTYRRAETVAMIQTLVNRHKIPDMLVVALPSGGDGPRQRDYTPSQEADQYLDFLQRELIPYVERNYRAASCRILSGHSRSGLLAFYAMLRRPNLFNAYLIASPAFWHDEDQIIGDAKSTFQSTESLDAFVSLFIGGRENENITNAFDRMRFVLRRFAPEGLDWRADELEFETHGTTSPVTHYLGLRRFFLAWDTQFDQVETWERFEADGGLQAYLATHRELSQRFGFQVKPQFLSKVGEHLAEQGRVEEAREALDIHLVLFPSDRTAKEKRIALD